MKATALGIKIMNARGLTLPEVIVTTAVLAILLAMAAISAKDWMNKYNAEKQLRIMHADLLQARTSAMERNRRYYALITANNYRIVADVNDSGGTTPDSVDLAAAPPATLLRYPATSSVTLIFDQKGLVSTSVSSLSSLPDIKFNTAGVTPEYDCFQVYATRINLGKQNGGGNCVAR
jgi:prepilin-type N-terminal cleavage/methylation domain-containing protein